MVNDFQLKYKKGTCGIGAPKVRLIISDSVELLNKEDWNAVLQKESIFLDTDYLKGLEKAMEASMEFRYVIYYCEKYTPIGIAYFQVVDLVDTGSKYADAVKKLGKGIGSKIVSELKVRSLVQGNVFHCGEYGYRFSEKVTSSEQLSLLENTANRLKQDGDLNSKVSIVVFKEFWPQSFPVSEELVGMRYHMFRMDMNMVMDLDSEWKGIDSYAQSLTSKSRTRLKSILKRSSDLTFTDWGADEIRTNMKKLDVLFKNVLDRSSFTFGVLEIEAYAQWKELIGDRLFFQAVHCNSELVGFMSAFLSESDLDVHYVGLEYTCNEEIGLYQRMLIEFLRYGIQQKVERINFGRTAEQAKSSLGARPVEMRLYTKHRNIIANKLIAPLMASVVPSEFELRSPFKKIN